MPVTRLTERTAEPQAGQTDCHTVPELTQKSAVPEIVNKVFRLRFKVEPGKVKTVCDRSFAHIENVRDLVFVAACPDKAPDNKAFVRESAPVRDHRMCIHRRNCAPYDPDPPVRQLTQVIAESYRGAEEREKRRSRYRLIAGVEFFPYDKVVRVTVFGDVVEKIKTEKTSDAQFDEIIPAENIRSDPCGIKYIRITA